MVPGEGREIRISSVASASSGSVNAELGTVGASVTSVVGSIIGICECVIIVVSGLLTARARRLGLTFVRTAFRDKGVEGRRGSRSRRVRLRASVHSG